ncbi:MAG: copper amine oxidase, partial [Sporomusaceae bacterium]|nr:copper amine oxidase [Sporomusaceae bacterium]
MKSIKRLLAALLLAAAVPAAAAAQLAPGQIRDLPEWPATISTYGGTLLLSDSPETVPADGILYQDTVQGTARLFFHHVNGTASDKKIVAILENAAEETAEVIVYRHGLAGPDLDYMRVGKEAQTRYLAGGGLYTVSVPAKGFALLDAGLDRLIVKQNMLVNGIYDFIARQPVTVKTIMLPVSGNSGKAARSLPVLPTDKDRLRGTFAGMDRLVLPLRPYRP